MPVLASNLLILPQQSVQSSINQPLFAFHYSSHNQFSQSSFSHCVCPFSLPETVQSISFVSLVELFPSLVFVSSHPDRSDMLHL